jgi:NADH-quinone oxidoreductase subunit L
MPKVFSTVWLVPLLPLLAAVATPALRRVLGREAHWPAVVGTGLSALFALIILPGAMSVAPDPVTHQWSAAYRFPVISEWVSLGGFQTGLFLQVDPLSAIMLATVTTVGFGVVIFSVGYMAGDPHYDRYFSFVCLFLFSMTMLVLADNFLVLYVFWEGVGLCSYLLVGFWFHKPAAADAAKKAFLVNRIGDIGLAVGILLIWSYFGTLQYAEVFRIASDRALWGEGLTYGVLAAVCLCLFWGCTGKSAQLPLYTWLPDAMEGPTPVSALIHAATMVTAGVYLVARCSPLFFPGGDVVVHGELIQRGGWPADWSITPPDVVAVTGVATALFAATIAVGQFDMKKILAYSTISQLGYMFLGLGVGATGAAVFHVHTHAFFKAALFLGAGVVMHATHGVIDIRKIGGLQNQLPTTYKVFLVASLALAGFPLTAGFFSKDAIVHEAFNANWILGAAALLTTVITAFYTFRLTFKVFWGREKLPAALHGHVHAPDLWMTAPIVVLAVMSVVSGYYGLGSHVGALGGFLDRAPHVHSVVGGLVDHEAQWFPAIAAMFVSTLAVAAGIYGAYVVFVKGDAPAEWPEEAPELREALENKYWVDEAYELVFVRPLERAAAFLRVFDRVAVSGVTYAVGLIPTALGWALRPLQSGYMQNYGLYMVAGLMIVCLAVLSRLAPDVGDGPAKPVPVRKADAPKPPR